MGQTYLVSLYCSPQGTQGAIPTTLSLGDSSYNLITNAYIGPYIPIQFLNTASDPITTMQLYLKQPGTEENMYNLFDYFVITPVSSNYQIKSYEIPNGDFETGSILPWTKASGTTDSGSAAVVCGDGNAASGQCYVSMSDYNSGITINLPVLPNKDYTITFNAKIASLIKGPVSIVYSFGPPATSNDINFDKTVYSASSADTQYKPYTVTFTTGTNQYTQPFAVGLQWMFDDPGTHTSLFLDDFTLIDTTNYS